MQCTVAAQPRHEETARGDLSGTPITSDWSMDDLDFQYSVSVLFHRFWGWDHDPCSTLRKASIHHIRRFELRHGSNQAYSTFPARQGSLVNKAQGSGQCCVASQGR
jgi:hypothetical protein